MPSSHPRFRRFITGVFPMSWVLPAAAISRNRRASFLASTVDPLGCFSCQNIKRSAKDESFSASTEVSRFTICRIEESAPVAPAFCSNAWSAFPALLILFVPITPASVLRPVLRACSAVARPSDPAPSSVLRACSLGCNTCGRLAPGRGGRS